MPKSSDARMSKRQEKLLLEMEDLNGYNNLPNTLKEKLRQYDFSTNTPLHVFFTWEEFCKVFECVTAQFILNYQQVNIFLENDGKQYVFWLENDKGQFLNKVVVSKDSYELLTQIQIENQRLMDLWEHLS